jgi:uracil-DNA glycosylase
MNEHQNMTISAVYHTRRGVVFLLWGKPAQQKATLVDGAKHRVLTAPHPSPLAAASGKLFVGCRHFSRASELLQQQDKPAIDWCIPP